MLARKEVKLRRLEADAKASLLGITTIVYGGGTIHNPGWQDEAEGGRRGRGG